MTGKTVFFLARHKYVVYLLFIFITIITLLLTLLPPANFEEQPLFMYDNLGHFLMFFGWTFMLGFSLIIRNRKLAPLLLIFLAGTAFGISIEIAQAILPYDRHASFWDAVMDSAGSLTAVILLWVIQTKYQSYLNPILSGNNNQANEHVG